MNTEHQNDYFVLFKAFHYVKTHWWLFLFQVMIVFGIYAAIYLKTPNVYESDARILVRSSSTNMPDRRQHRVTTTRELRAQRNNLAQLLKSDDVLSQFSKNIVAYYQKENLPTYFKHLVDEDSVSTSYLAKNITLRWNHSSDIFRLRCTSENPEAAQKLCSLYIDTVTKIYPEILQRRLFAEQEFLNRQIATLSKQIAEKQLELADFEQEDEDFFDFVIASEQEASPLQKMRTEFIDLQRKLEVNTAIKRMLINIPHRNALDHTSLLGSIQALKSRIVEVKHKQQLTKMSDSPEKEVRLKALNRELNLLVTQLNNINQEADQLYEKAPVSSEDVRDRLANLEMEEKVDRLRLKRLVGELDKRREKEKDYRTRRLEYNRIKSDLGHSKKLVTRLFVQEQATRLELSIGNSEVFNVQKPSQNRSRIAPKLSGHLFASVSISLFLCVVTALLMTILLPRIDSASEAHKLKLPILGKIPRCKEDLEIGTTPCAFTLERTKIMSYRILRETKDKKCPVVVVSSPQPGEGKSTVANLLNIATQSPSKKTLAIDGDLIAANPYNIFGIAEDETVGIQGLLTNYDTDQDPSQLVVATRYEGVDFLPRGGQCESTSAPEYLNTVKAVIEQLRGEYDMIVIDTPPLTTSHLAQQWFTMADLVILVARVHQTNPKDIEEAVDTTKLFTDVPIGVALNCVQPTKKSEYSRSYNYFSRRKRVTT